MLLRLKLQALLALKLLLQVPERLLPDGAKAKLQHSFLVLSQRWVQSQDCLDL
jgi:hypothetical protein